MDTIISQILATQAAGKQISKDLTYELNQVRGRARLYEDPAEFAVKELKNYFEFFQSPQAALVLSHQLGVKEVVIKDLEVWTKEDIELYHYVADGGQALQAAAFATIERVKSVPFLYHVDI